MFCKLFTNWKNNKRPYNLILWILTTKKNYKSLSPPIILPVPLLSIKQTNNIYTYINFLFS